METNNFTSVTRRNSINGHLTSNKSGEKMENSRINSQITQRSELTRQKTNDIVIRQTIFVIGMAMAFFMLGCLAEANLRNDGWNESQTKRITILATLFLILVLLVIVVIVLVQKITDVRRQQTLIPPILSVSQEAMIFIPVFCQKSQNHTHFLSSK